MRGAYEGGVKKLSVLTATVLVMTILMLLIRKNVRGAASFITYQILMWNVGWRASSGELLIDEGGAHDADNLKTLIG